MVHINGMPANRDRNSGCMWDHAPNGSTRQEFIDLRASLVMSGIHDPGEVDDISDEDYDKFLSGLAETCADIRKRNKLWLPN